MAFIQCVNNDCKEKFTLPSNFLSNFEEIVLNGTTSVPQWEIQCPKCDTSNFVTPNLKVVGVKE